MGPSALRVAGLNARIAALGYKVKDLGNLHVEPAEALPEGDADAKYLAQIAAACKRLAALTGEALSRGDVPLVLGGDHSVAVGSVSGVFMSAWASSQITPTFCLRARKCFDTPETEPTATE